jgi:flavorubredoxin
MPKFATKYQTAMNITSDIVYVGVDDADIDLFENQYAMENGVTYNSYVINDEHIAVMDTVDKRKTGEWLKNVASALNGRAPEYLVVQHMEPDHAASIGAFVALYPDVKIVATDAAIKMMPLYFENVDFASRVIGVKEGATLSLGKHNLTFYMAPMVHWPEVMVTYDATEKVLFSADAFGKFGISSDKHEWEYEARRYFINIVGKYGKQVQALLAKASKLDISIICPLHGPVLSENLGKYISLYDTWSSYRPESEGVVIAHASIHGNTANAAEKLAELLREKGVTVEVYDLTRGDQSRAVEAAFRYSELVVAASTYDASIFPPMAHFLHHLKQKAYQNRKVAIIENGSWAPVAGKVMREAMAELKDVTLVADPVTIRGAVKQQDVENLKALAAVL